MASSIHSKWASQLNQVTEEIIGLLANRHIFRTIQEILRRNTRVPKYPAAFSHWTWVVYVAANGAGVRRLAGQSADTDDVSLFHLLGEMIRNAGELWEPFHRHFPTDLAQAQAKAAEQASNDDMQCRVEACRRLIAEDRKLLSTATAPTIHFASKRVAHRNLTKPVRATFNDLDRAVDIIKSLTEKYLLLVHDKTFDLAKVMKRNKLGKGWDGVFLIPWATPDILALPLGEMVPPRAPTRS
jgi:hypothetical protein